MTQAVRAITSDELLLLRASGDWTRARLAIYKPNVIYTALLNGAPASTDMVGEITFDGGTGTLANVKAEMTLWVGTSAGARDLGTCRIRKAPSGATIYIGYTSEIAWADNCYLTIVDHAILSKKPVLISAGDILMDGEHAYTDQHEDFDPVPVLTPHAVAKLTGATVDVAFDASDSWVYGSTITGYSWSAPGTSATSGMTTATPTLTYNAAGHYRVSCTVTAANGKTCTGVRFVMVFDATHKPFSAGIQSPSADYDTGGWSFNVHMFAGAETTEIIEGALCVLFAEDWYGSTKQSLGQVANRENIICSGYIAGESIDWDAEAGTVEFSVQGPHYWLKQISANPLYISMAIDTPSTWEVMPALTVDLALWHMLHWRSNATALLNVTLSGDDRYSPKFESMSGSLWSQMEDVAWEKIFARLGCDRYGRFYAVIDPQLVPEADRTWATVMTLTKKDWRERINIKRNSQRKVAMLSMAGWMVDITASVSTLYSLAMGHVYAQYGESEILDKVLVSSQSQSNDLAGLYMGWKNNELEFDVELAQNNRMVDLWPNQFLNVSLAAGDTPRGIAYAGNLVPRSITLHPDPEAGTWSTEVFSEAETFPEISMDGDIPASTGMEEFDDSFPEFPGMPAFPALPPIVYTDPGTTNANHPKKVVIASSKGVFYTEDFDAELTETTPGPTWKAMNAGLNDLDRSDIYQMVVTPSGAIYVHLFGDKVLRASGLGGTFVEVTDGSEFPYGIHSIAVHPNQSDKIIIVGLGKDYFIAGNVRFATGGALSGAGGSVPMRYAKGATVYLNGKWYAMGCAYGVFTTPWLCRYSDGGSLEYDGTIETWVGQDAAIRFAYALTDSIFQWGAAGSGGFNLITSDGTVSTRSTAITPQGDSTQAFSFSPTGSYGMGADNDTFIRPQKTTDGGSSFSILTATLPVGSDVWENCRDNNRWIFGGGQTIHLTVDMGATYVSKLGNLIYIAPLLDITHIRFIQ